MAQIMTVERVILRVVMLKKMHPLFYGGIFHNVSLWEKVYLSPGATCDDVIIGFSHYKVDNMADTLEEDALSLNTKGSF